MEEPLWIPATKKSGYPSHKRKLRAGVGVTIESSDTTTPPNDSGKIIINELEAAAEAAGITRKWTPVCLSSADWRRFPRQFANSKSEVEKDFYEFLINHALPHVVPHIEVGYWFVFSFCFWSCFCFVLLFFCYLNVFCVALFVCFVCLFFVCVCFFL